MRPRPWLAAHLAVVTCVACTGDAGREGTPSSEETPAARADTADTATAVPEGAVSPETAAAGAAPSDTAGDPGPLIHPRPGTGPDAAADPADSASWTTDVAFAPPTASYPPSPVLTALRTGTHPGYTRLVVEIVPEAGGLPGYRVEYVDRPLIECGSGRRIFPVGDAWLEIRMEPAAAHDEAGRPTIGEREIAVDAPLLLRVYRTCNFEGIVTFVMALAEPNPFRVLTLSDPWRIVVDVQRSAGAPPGPRARAAAPCTLRLHRSRPACRRRG